jgi:hypothetical protein
MILGLALAASSVPTVAEPVAHEWITAALPKLAELSEIPLA